MSKSGARMSMEDARALAKRTGNTDLMRQLDMPVNRPIPERHKPASAPGAPESHHGAQEPPKVRNPKEMNKTEREYHAILSKQFPDCEIGYEMFTFRLADRKRYTPDLSVTSKDHRVIFFEVKGKFLFRGAHKSATDSSLTKAYWAAHQLPFRFHIAQKIDGRWEVTALRGKIDT